MNNFFTSALLGLSISIPVGTVTIQMMKQGLRNGFLYGWMVGLGGMTFDLLMIMLIYFGFSTYLNLPAVQQVMWLIGCLFLLYLSIDSFKESRRKKRDGRRAELPLHKKNPICPVCWLLFPLPILCSGLAYSGPCLPLPSSNPRLRSVS